VKELSGSCLTCILRELTRLLELCHKTLIMKPLSQFCLFCLLLLIPAEVFSQGSRVALVIGNSEYQNTGFLLNPVNDAADISQALRNTGFEVLEYKNLGLVEMKRTIDLFGARLMNHDVGLFYYAGHGIQARGVNYLVPVDAKIYSENDVEYNCVDVGRMLAKMEDAGSRTNIVILDACRDNPFERSWTRSTRGRGLAFMNAPTGSLIAYATSPGTTASDGSGDNGLYTSAILNHIYEEDVSILQMFQKVRKDVREVSGGTQIPWESTSLEGDFYLAGPDAVIKEPTGNEVAVPVAAGITPGIGPREENTQTNKENADPFAAFFPDNQLSTNKSNIKPSAGLTGVHFLSQTTGIRTGDAVFYNKYSSTGWLQGTIVKMRNNRFCEISYVNNRGLTRSEVIGKNNIILSKNKRIPLDNSEVKVNDIVYFFTNFDKLIKYGRVTAIEAGNVTIQSMHQGADSHTVPMSAILIEDFK